MGPVIFIGDELSAAGFRLAGVEALVPAPDAVAHALQEARSRAALVVITAELARTLPPTELDQVALAEAPTLAIVPDVLFRAAAPDLIRRLRSALGIEV